MSKVLDLINETFEEASERHLARDQAIARLKRRVALNERLIARHSSKIDRLVDEDREDRAVSRAMALILDEADRWPDEFRPEAALDPAQLGTSDQYDSIQTVLDYLNARGPAGATARAIADDIVSVGTEPRVKWMLWQLGAFRLAEKHPSAKNTWVSTAPDGFRFSELGRQRPFPRPTANSVVCEWIRHDVGRGKGEGLPLFQLFFALVERDRDITPSRVIPLVKDQIARGQIIQRGDVLYPSASLSAIVAANERTLAEEAAE